MQTHFWKNFPHIQDITAVQQNYFPHIAAFVKLFFIARRQLP
jgi:hypothetical protein